VSRTASKLNDVATTIRSKNPKCTVETLAVDFASATPADYSRLASFISDKDISILVNNVGQSHSIPVPFAETAEDEMNNIITINCQGTLKVTQLVLPGMTSRKRGLILTMGSFGGLLPTPLLATYSGSKAFLQNWSNALASEVAPLGISVYFVHSYLVTSRMSKIRRPTWLVPTEKAFVKSVLSKIGRRCGSVGYAFSGSPYWSHAVSAFGMIAAPGFGVYGSRMLGLNKDMHVQIRKRALAKRDKAAKTC